MDAVYTEFSLADFLPYRMMVVAERLSAGLAKQYREEFGITVAEWRVLVHVADAGAVSIRDIHNRVHLEKTKASRAATRLEAAGLLSKEENPDDRRLIVLALTPEGQTLMGKLVALAVDYQARLNKLLEPHGDALNSALDQLLAEEL